MNNPSAAYIRLSLKILMLLLILAELNAQSPLGRVVELNKMKYSTREVISELQKEHSISISHGKIPSDNNIVFDIKKQSVKAILEKALQNSNLRFRVVGKKIIIFLKTDESERSGNTATISGFVREANSGEALIGATIYDSRSGKGVVANNYGFFSLTLPKDSVSLHVSYLGFETQKASFQLSEDQTIHFDLESALEMLDEVTVEGSLIESVELTPQMSTISVTAKQIEHIPMILGEPDVLKAIQLLPGIQGGTEGASGIYVRGGGPDQNLFLMDGVPVYNTSHLFGFFSVFNGDAINNINIIKGGFPARYGGRLSSVIDISMKEGNNQRLSGKGSVGVLSSKFTVEGPIKNEKTSFILSGRRTFLDILAKPFGVTDENSFYFYDFNAKINHRFSEKDRIFLSFYGGNDTFSSASEDEAFSLDGSSTKKTNSSGIKWGNIVSILRWNHVFNPKLFGSLSSYISRFKFDTFDERSVFTADSLSSKAFNYNSGVRDLGLKADFEYDLTTKYSMRFGGSALFHQFKTGVFNLTSTQESSNTAGGDNIHAREYDIYLENDFSVGKKLRLNAGVHASLFEVNNSKYTAIQPRISGRLLLNKQLSFKASYSEMSQFIHLLVHSGVGLPTDLWVPATDQVEPQFSRQAAFGAAKVIGPFEITLEGYYKEMENLIEYENGASYLSSGTSWEDKVEVGSGRSYGMEFLLRKNTGRLTGWVGYTLSKTTRQFDELNSGNEFLYRYDRRHDISAVATYRLNDNWTLSGNWVFGSGNRTTIPVSRYFQNGYSYSTSSNKLLHHFGFIIQEDVEGLAERNNYQLQNYHRLDISVSHSKQKKRGIRIWTFGIYNAYSRLNPFFVFVDQAINPNFLTSNAFVVSKLKQQTLLPAIPFVNYSFRF